MTSLPSPYAQWRQDRLSASTLELTPMYWHFDGTSWDLVSDRALESGKLADIGGGVFDFVTPASAVASGTTIIVGAQRPDGVIIVY